MISSSSKHLIPNPVLVIGMHRSGTTMLTKMLRHLGIFFGADLEENSESKIFIKQNDWYLQQLGARWDYPMPALNIEKSESLQRMAREYLEDRIRGIDAIHYLGVSKYLRQLVPRRNDNMVFGIKDPRLTFSLPVFMDIFPNAKILHVYRNGVPVAASLQKRELHLLQKAENLHKKRKLLGIYRIVSKKGGFVWSPRCLSLEGGFSLWEEYVDQARVMVERFEPNALEVRYEDFLAAPCDGLKRITDFLRIEASEQMIEEAAMSSRSDRAQAFMQSDELACFYQKVKDRPLMQRFGYGNE